MKQVSRGLVLLLVLAVVIAAVSTSVFAASGTDEYPYDGEGTVNLAWNRLNNVSRYDVTLYFKTVNDPALDSKRFGPSETTWDVTNYIKANGPGMYPADIIATKTNGTTVYGHTDLLVIQNAKPDAPTVEIGEDAATVSWPETLNAPIGCKVVATLTDKTTGETFTQEYEVPAGETSVDITEFVEEHADSETPLELSATLTVLGDLTVVDGVVGDDGKEYKGCYLNSEPSEPGVAVLDPTADPAEPQLVGQLPTAVITSTEVYADLPDHPGQLFVDYAFNDNGAVDYTYVDKLTLKLEGTTDKDKTVTITKVLNAADYTDGVIPSSGTIDVSGIIPDAADYTWTISLDPKYVGNEAQADTTGTVVYNIYDLPAPVLTVADDASTISWPVVVASDDVTEKTAFDDADFYKIEVSEDGNNWSEITGGAITPVTDAEGNVESFVVDISDKIAEGQTKHLKVTLTNKKDGSVYDPRFTETSSAEVEVYKTIQPTNVAFDLVKDFPVVDGATDYLNPPADDWTDKVYLKWTEPTSTDGIASYLITIYKAVTTPAEDPSEDPTVTETSETLTVAAADVIYVDGIPYVDVSELIDAENVADYTATVQSIGAHGNAAYKAGTFGASDGAHFDADSGVTPKCAPETSGAVASAQQSASIVEQDGKLVLIVNLTDTNSNIDKVESVWLSNFNNGNTSYLKVIKGNLDKNAATVTFDLSEFYADPNNDQAVLPSGTWTGDVSVYSYNAGLNADTTVNVSATYDPEKLEIRGEELADENGQPILDENDKPTYGEPLVVDPETGVVTWLDAYAYDDETDEKIEDSKADYYNVKLEYYNGSSWKSIKLQGSNDAEWEKLDDTEADTNQYVINDPDAADGAGMVPGRVYRVVVQAFSDRPLVYAASNEESTYLCKLPAVVPTINKADGTLSWTGTLPEEEFTYPDGTNYQIDAVGETTYTDTDTDGSPYPLADLLEDYGEYSTTVTALGQVVEDQTVGQDSGVTVNYIDSDVSEAVTAYRGVVPAEDITDVAFEFAAGNVLNLNFKLPVADENTSDYDKAMIDAIDPDTIKVRLYSDTGNLLGEYDAVKNEDGSFSANVTPANELSTGNNWTQNIDPGTTIKVAILVNSIDKFVDGYAELQTLEPKTQPELATYLLDDVADDAVKVVALELPARPAIVLEPYIDTETGDLVIPADPTAEADFEADLSYTVVVSYKNEDGGTVSYPIAVTGPTTDDSDPDNVKTLYSALTSAKIPAGNDYVTVTVTAEDGNKKYADSTVALKAYKLENPVINSISKEDGYLDKFVDEPDYAHTHSYTFANADDAEATENAYYDDPNVKFDLEAPVHNVTTTITSTGGYDVEKDIYVIDADNVATATTKAGELFHFTMVGDQIKVDANDNYYVEIQADTTHPFWNKTNSKNYMWWEGEPNDLKGTFKAANGATIPTKSLVRANDVDFSTGVVKLYFDGIPTPETEYTLELTTNPKAKFAGVAGGYTETLAVDEVPSTVSYNAKYLVVEDLQYDYEEGKVTWSEDENADSYLVTLEKKIDDNWTGVANASPVEVTDPAYVVDPTLGYEAGTQYRVTVVATNSDPNWEDSRPSVDNSIIYIYKLLPAEDVAVSDKTGELSYTDPAANAAYAHDKEVTVTPDSAEDDTIPAGAYNETDNKVEFTKVGTPDDVTTSVTLTGGYDSTSDYYVLDSEAKDTANNVGELFHFSLANNGAIQKDSNGYYVELEAITPHDFWSEDNDLNYLWWQGAPNDLKGVLTGDSGTINTKPITKAQRDAALTSGKIKLYLKSAPADSEYTLALTTNPKAKYAAVAGGYTEELSPVTYGVQYLEVKDLKYDYDEEKVTWTDDPNATSYAITLEKKIDDNWTGVAGVDPVTDPAYDIDPTLGYDAGTEYRVTVTATSDDANWEDSRPDVDGSVIYIYKLLPAEDVAVSDRDGALTYTDPAANNAYAHSYAASFDPSGKGSEADKVVEFVKTAQPPEEVTTSVTLTGGYDSVSEYYVLDSEPADTKNLVGELFHFTVIDNKITKDGDKYYIQLQAPIDHDFWGPTNDDTYIWWQGTPNDLKVDLIDGGNVIANKPVKRANVDFATGVVTVYLDAIPTEGVEYTVKVTANPKAKYAAVAGAYADDEIGTATLAAPVTPPDAPSVEGVDLDDGTITVGDGSSESGAKFVKAVLTKDGEAAADTFYTFTIYDSNNEPVGDPVEKTENTFTPTWGEGGLAVGEVYTVSITITKNGLESEPTTLQICKQAAPVEANIIFKQVNGKYNGEYTVDGVEDISHLSAEVLIGNTDVTEDVEAPSYVNDDIIAGAPDFVTIKNVKFAGYKADTANIYYIASETAAENGVTSDFKVGRLPALYPPEGELTTESIKNEDGEGVVVFTFTKDDALAIAKATLALAEKEWVECLPDYENEEVTFIIPAANMEAIGEEGASYAATLEPAYPAINAPSYADVAIAYEEPAPEKTPIPAVDPLYYGIFKSRDGKINTANTGGATLYFKEVEGAKLKKDGGYLVTISDNTKTVEFGADELNTRKRLPVEYDSSDTYYISVKRTALNAAFESGLSEDTSKWTVTITDYPIDTENYKENTSVFTFDGTGEGSESDPAGITPGLIPTPPTPVTASVAIAADGTVTCTVEPEAAADHVTFNYEITAAGEEEISDFDDDGSFALPTDLTPGKVYTMTVSAIADADSGFATSESVTAKFYRLNAPTDLSIDTKTGELSFTEDTTYAHGEADVQVDNGAAYNKPTITFPKESESPVEVTATVTSKGMFDDEAEVYTLDSYPANSDPVTTGMAPKLALDSITAAEGEGATGAVVVLKIDTNNALCDTPKWKEVSVTATPLEGSDLEPLKVINIKDYVDLAAGTVTIPFPEMVADTDYLIEVSEVIKDKFQAVAGCNGTYKAGEGRYDSPASGLTAWEILRNAAEYDYADVYTYKGVFVVDEESKTVTYKANRDEVYDPTITEEGNQVLRQELNRFFGAIYTANPADAVSEFKALGDMYWAWDPNGYSENGDSWNASGADAELGCKVHSAIYGAVEAGVSPNPPLTMSINGTEFTFTIDFTKEE